MSSSSSLCWVWTGAGVRAGCCRPLLCCSPPSPLLRRGRDRLVRLRRSLRIRLCCCFRRRGCRRCCRRHRHWSRRRDFQRR
ncbi:hypothetical protein PF006_g31368 [Phytophthora fragariae]|uniref:Uncharacterized protein n=1 Tax=Phytophthora fragariae TaxID=53985 RepID=A0A6A3PWG3_9STRA|nr:hypothetical protein PF006_g31368 [Phytophthora fragariae]